MFRINDTKRIQLTPAQRAELLAVIVEWQQDTRAEASELALLALTDDATKLAALRVLGGLHILDELYTFFERTAPCQE